MFKKIHAIWKEIEPYSTIFSICGMTIGGILGYFSSIVSIIGMPLSILIGSCFGVWLIRLISNNKQKDKYDNNEILNNQTLIYKTTKLDVVFTLQESSIAGYVCDRMIISTENLSNIAYQTGRLYSSISPVDKGIIAIIFIEFTNPLETIAINAYELNKKEKNKGCIEILYTKSCMFGSKSVITACSIALHGINNNDNSSFRIQFLPSS
jgi:hypothetical protein